MGIIFWKGANTVGTAGHTLLSEEELNLGSEGQVLRKEKKN